MSGDFPWLWVLALVVAIILVAELYAYFAGKQTLSRYVVRLTDRAPRLIPFIVGAIIGGLAVHFWLPWCPS